MTSDPASIPPFAPSKVERAVKREMQRQRFLSVLFAVLLLIPLGLAAFYWRTGRTDREIVRDEVTRGVAPVERLARQVEPALAEVQEASSAVLEQERRVQVLIQSQEDVRTQLSQLNEVLPRLQASMVQAEELSKQLSGLRAKMDAQDKSLSSIIESQTRFAHEQERIAGEVKGSSARVAPFQGLDELKRGFAQLHGRLDALDRRVHDQPQR